MAAIAGEPVLTNSQAMELVRWGFESDSTKTGGSDLVKAARKSFQEGNPEDALRIVSKDKIIPLANDVERVLIQNLSTARGQHNEKVAPTKPTEIIRYNAAKSSAEEARNFIEKDSIAQPIRDKVKSYLLHDPRFAIIMADKTAVPDQDMYTETMMKLPVYKDKLRGVYTKTLEPTRRLEHSASVSRIQKELEELKAQIGVAVTPAEITAAQAKISQAELALSQAGADRLKYSTSLQLYNSDAKFVQGYRTQRSHLEPGVAAKLTKRDLLQQDYDAKYASNPNDASLPGIKSQIEDFANNDKNLSTYDSLDAKIKGHEALGVEIARLEGIIKPLEQAVADAKSELAELRAREKAGISASERARIEAAIKAKERELIDEQSLEESDMILYASEITSMPETAMQEFLTEAFTQLKKLWTAEATKEMEKVGTVEASLAESGADKLENAWRRIGNVKLKNGTQLSIFENDPTLITPWLQLILNPAKQHELFSTGFGTNYLALISSIPDRDTKLKDPQLLHLGLTIHEVKALKKFIKDPKWMKEQMLKWRGDLLGDYFLSGGQMNEAVTKYLARDPNGRELLNRAIAAARERAGGHQAAKSQVEQIELELKQLYGKDFSRQNGFDWQKWRPILLTAGLTLGAIVVGSLGYNYLLPLLGGIGAALQHSGGNGAPTATATATATAAATAAATATPIPPSIGGVLPGAAP